MNLDVSKNSLCISPKCLILSFQKENLYDFFFLCMPTRLKFILPHIAFVERAVVVD